MCWEEVDAERQLREIEVLISKHITESCTSTELKHGNTRH